MATNRFNDTVLSFAKGLTIMETLNEYPGGLSLAGLSELVNMNKTTVYRFLTTLIEKEYVSQDETAKYYCLNDKFARLARVAMKKSDLQTIVWKHAAALAVSHKAEVFISKWDRNRLLVIDRRLFEGMPDLVRPGQEIPLCFTAAGRVFLANFSEPQRQDLIKKDCDNGYTPFSASGRKAVETAVLYTKLQGYSVENREYLPNVVSIAVPLFDHSRNAAAALGMLLPADLCDEHLKANIILKLMDAAEAISFALGYNDTRWP